MREPPSATRRLARCCAAACGTPSPAAERPPCPRGRTPVTASEDPSQLLDAMAEALAAAPCPATRPHAVRRHTEFLGWRPPTAIGELPRGRGERNVPQPDDPRRARLPHHSDFPLLSAAANEMLLAAYAPAAPTALFLRRDFRDFKPHRHLRIRRSRPCCRCRRMARSRSGPCPRARRPCPADLARRIRVTRQMLVNDDLGAFTDFASMIGRRVADFENATAYALLNSARRRRTDARHHRCGGGVANRAAQTTVRPARRWLDTAPSAAHAVS